MRLDMRIMKTRQILRNSYLPNIIDSENNSFNPEHLVHIPMEENDVIDAHEI